MAVELNVRTQLSKIAEELETITKKARQVGDALKQGSDDASEELTKQTKKTENFLTGLTSLARRASQQIRNDFKSLISINAISDSLKLSEQFKGSIREAFNLTDAIRKLGPTLGVVSGDFVRFQSNLMKGLGQIGLSSDAAASALGGLAKTPVRGEANLISYSKTAGELASVSREQGHEGDIAKGLAQVLVAQGRSPNDTAAMEKVAQDVLRIRNATGQGATEALGALTNLYSGANKDFLPKLRAGGGVSLAAGALLGGQGATSFLQRYLGMNRIDRLALEAQGFGRIIGKNGELNSGAIQSTLAEARGRGLGDAQAGLKTYGLSDEEAQGFIRLGQALKDNADVIERARTQVVDLNKTYHESMGFGEAFRANLNRVKGILATPLSLAANAGAGALGKASESTAGSLAVVAGGGALAALLAGLGLKGVGTGLGLLKGQVAKKAGAEPVYVVNASEIRGSGVGDVIGGAAAAAGAGSLLVPLAAAAVGVAATTAVAYGAGKGISYAKERYDIARAPSQSLDQLKSANLDRFAAALDRLASSPVLTKEQQTKLIIENRSRDLKASHESSRGTHW